MRGLPLRSTPDPEFWPALPAALRAVDAAPDPSDRAVPGRPTVVIHTNDQQLVAALVAAHALRSRSEDPGSFDVRILRLEETPRLLSRLGTPYFWWDEQHPTRWRNDYEGAFFPLRRMVPSLLGFTGRALVIDPDIVALGDVNELLSRDMNGKAVLCRRREERYRDRPLYSTAVMLLDCAKLTAWDWDKEMDAVFSGQLRLGPWLGLYDVPEQDIGLIEAEWNSLDTLNERTKLLHFTRAETQPWRTGLLSDHQGHVPQRARPIAWLHLEAERIRSKGAHRPIAHRRHPDPDQERVFFATLADGLEHGAIPEDLLRWARRKRYLRPDVFRVLAAVRGAGAPPETAVGL